jgi:hypothetical protein
MVCTNSSNDDMCIEKSLLKSINQLDKVYQNNKTFNYVINFIDDINNAITKKDYTNPDFKYIEFFVINKLDPNHPDNYELINKAKLIIKEFTSKNNYSYNYDTKAYYLPNSSNYSINYSYSSNSSSSSSSSSSSNNFPFHLNIY